MNHQALHDAAVKVANSGKFRDSVGDSYTRMDIANAIVSEYLSHRWFKPTKKDLVQIRRSCEQYVNFVLWDKPII